MSYIKTSKNPAGHETSRTILEIGDSLTVYRASPVMGRVKVGFKKIAHKLSRSKYTRHQGVQECSRRMQS